MWAGIPGFRRLYTHLAYGPTGHDGEPGGLGVWPHANPICLCYLCQEENLGGEHGSEHFRHSLVSCGHPAGPWPNQVFLPQGWLEAPGFPEPTRSHRASRRALHFPSTLLVAVPLQNPTPPWKRSCSSRTEAANCWPLSWIWPWTGFFWPAQCDYWCF